MSDIVHPTRADAFQARLRQRYAAERRFRALGLGAVLFSFAVLAFLLITMTINGISGFQRVEVEIPVDFREAALTLDPSMSDRDAIVRSLQDQGLPAVIDFYAERALGAFRVSADAIVAAMKGRPPTLWPSTSTRMRSLSFGRA